MQHWYIEGNEHDGYKVVREDGTETGQVGDVTSLEYLQAIVRTHNVCLGEGAAA